MDEDVSRKNPKETSPIPLTLEYLVLISLPTFYFRYFSYILRYIYYTIYMYTFRTFPSMRICIDTIF